MRTPISSPKSHTVVTPILLEHLGVATDLISSMVTPALNWISVQSLEDICGRFEATLDALRVSGASGLSIARDATAVSPDSAAALAYLLAESDRPALANEAVTLLYSESTEGRRAAWWGLRRAKCGNVEPYLRGLLGRQGWDFAAAAALDVLAFHRVAVQAEIDGVPDEEGDEIAWLLAEAGGRMRGAWSATHLKQFLEHASQRVREAALRAAARCGIPELHVLCREATSRLEPTEAIEFLGVVGGPEDLPRLQRAASSPAAARAAVNGLGRLGLPAAVPLLLDLMSTPELAEPAAFAFWRITGKDVPRGPAPEPSHELSEDELDLWEPQPPVNLPGVREWWETNSERFAPDIRYQVGLNVDDAPLGSVFDRLPLAIRYDVYLRERALTPGTPDWELETWTWAQKHPAESSSRPRDAGRVQ